jgi:hypothetical protein
MLLPHHLGLELIPLHPLIAKHVPEMTGEIYYLHPNVFQVFSPSQRKNIPQTIDALGKLGIQEFYVKEKDFLLVQELVYQKHQEATRKLSVGEAQKRGDDFMLAMQMSLAVLYEDFHHHQLLSLIYQTTPSFVLYLQLHKSKIPDFYHSIQNRMGHFIYKQPLLSSLFLVYFCQVTHLFDERELQDLFVVSLLKDIGMSLVPRSAWDKTQLEANDELALSSHATNSVHLLKERTPIPKSGLHIVEHHHFHNDVVRNFLADGILNEHDDLFLGIETSLVAIADLIAAMHSSRPFRPAYPLSTIKKIVSLIMNKNYPKETKLLLDFMNYFFKYTD